jgi:hypothetical protein
MQRAALHRAAHSIHGAAHCSKRCCNVQHGVLRPATRGVPTCNPTTSNLHRSGLQPAAICVATCNTLLCRMRHAVLQRAARHLATCCIPCCRVQHEVLQVATSSTPHPTCYIDHATCNMLCCTPWCNVPHAVLQHYAVCTACSMLRATRTECGVDNPACSAHHVARAAATAHRACTRAAPPRAARSARPARR